MVSELTEVFTIRPIYLCFRAIRFPFKSRLTPCMTSLIALSIYTLALGVPLPELYLTTYHQQPGSNVHWFCESSMSNRSNLVYSTVQSTIVTFIPLTIIITIQILAFRTLRSSSQHFQQDRHRLLQLREVSHTFLLIVAVFFLSTAPVSVYTISAWYIAVYHEEFLQKNGSLMYDISKPLNLLLVLQNCANPLIYGRVNVRIKKKVRLFIARICRKVDPHA